MLNRRTLLGAAALTTPMLLAGCASAPTYYYRLAVIPGPVSGNAAFSIRMRNINVPAYLRQTGIAKPGSAYQFETFATAAWASPLNGMLLDVSTQELSQRLPNCTVVRANGAIIAPADVVVEANVMRFDPDPSGLITLDVQIAIKSGRGMAPWLVRSFAATAQPAGKDPAAVAATMSSLWAGVMDQLAPLLAEQWAAHQ